MTYNLPKTRVKPVSIKLLLSAIALLVVINLLARVGVIDFTSFQPAIITLVSAISLLGEVGFTNRGSKLNPFDWVIVVISLLSLLGVIFGFLGTEIVFLTIYQVWIGFGLSIAVLIEIFR